MAMREIWNASQAALTHWIHQRWLMNGLWTFIRSDRNSSYRTTVLCVCQRLWRMHVIIIVHVYELKRKILRELSFAHYNSPRMDENDRFTAHFLRIVFPGGIWKSREREIGRPRGEGGVVKWIFRFFPSFLNIHLFFPSFSNIYHFFSFFEHLWFMLRLNSKSYYVNIVIHLDLYEHYD